MNFSELVGKTLSDVKVGETEIFFETTDGERYKMYHEQDCCESVSVEDVVGDVKSLIGNPILVAEERSNNNDRKVNGSGYQDDSCTWTFYEIATIKGAVTMRWYGTSNGYYSESVSITRI